MSDHNEYTSESESETEAETDTKSINDYYPLSNTWVLYDHIKSDSNTYETSTRKICEFDTVVGFWQVFNNYPKPSSLFYNQLSRPFLVQNENKKEITSISVFKKGILPKWEDPVNKHGAEFSKRKFNKKNPLREIDENWNDLLMACIGHLIDKSVTGIRVVDSSAFKKDKTGQNELKLLYRIEIWFDDLAKKDTLEKQFKELLSIDDQKAIFYKEHTS
jgi:Eukaryotic initiation factor 4E